MGRDLGDDLEDPTEDTDKHPLPQISKKKLTLPKPDDVDDDPTFDENPTPVPKAKLPPLKPAPAPARPSRISVFRVPPAKSGSPLLLGIVGVLIAVVVVAFLVAPDGKTSAEIARRQLRDPQQREGKSFRDWFTLGPSSTPAAEVIVESPQRTAQWEGKARPTPQRKRHAGAQRKSGALKAPVNAEQRYGFERIEQADRHYDNYDSQKELGNGIPMLMVFSKPAGMAVDVDGALAGMTPLIRPLPKDTKRVKVRLHGAGFKEWEQTVSPNQIEQFKVGVTMQPIAE